MKGSFFDSVTAVVGWKHPLLQVPAAFIGATMSYLFGGWSEMLGILLGLVVLDYFTGMLAAGKLGELRSTVGRVGIRNKIFIFAMVAVGYQVDKLLGTPGVILTAAVFFYAANELLSITENAGKAGLPVHPALINAVAVLKGKSGIEKD